LLALTRSIKTSIPRSNCHSLDGKTQSTQAREASEAKCKQTALHFPLISRKDFHNNSSGSNNKKKQQQQKKQTEHFHKQFSAGTICKFC